MEIFIAGAGAGKTTTMADKIIKLHNEIEEHRIIFCITFTNNAVSCIEKKLTDYYGEMPGNIMVSTIHSFLYREIIKPYYYLLYNKHYKRISSAELPPQNQYRNTKIKRLENGDILHQTVIPERAKWVIYKKSADKKEIKAKRDIIKKNFAQYCGAICVDETQDIDSDMQKIIEEIHNMNIPVLLMGDPKQDLKGHKCLNNLIENYKDNVTYIDICYRCPEKHLNLSNLIVKKSEQQHSSKNGGLISVVFESDKPCDELIKENSFDLLYISKKQDKYDTHKQIKNYDSISAISEEIEIIIRKKRPNLDEFVLQRAAYIYAEKIMRVYKKTGDKRETIKLVFKNFKIEKRDYGILINLIPDSDVSEKDDKVNLNSIDSIKGKEGENCLFILTPDLAAYMFGDKDDDNATKNRLYVALTRSLNKLTIFITDKVEKKYGKEKLMDFFAKYI